VAALQAPSSWQGVWAGRPLLGEASPHRTQGSCMGTGGLGSCCRSLWMLVKSGVANHRIGSPRGGWLWRETWGPAEPRITPFPYHLCRSFWCYPEQLLETGGHSLGPGASFTMCPLPGLGGRAGMGPDCAPALSPAPAEAGHPTPGAETHPDLLLPVETTGGSRHTTFPASPPHPAGSEARAVGDVSRTFSSVFGVTPSPWLPPCDLPVISWQNQLPCMYHQRSLVSSRTSVMLDSHIPEMNVNREALIKSQRGQASG
jgi:hypothetical protein